MAEREREKACEWRGSVSLLNVGEQDSCPRKSGFGYLILSFSLSSLSYPISLLYHLLLYLSLFFFFQIPTACIQTVVFTMVHLSHTNPPPAYWMVSMGLRPLISLSLSLQMISLRVFSSEVVCSPIIYKMMYMCYSFTFLSPSLSLSSLSCASLSNSVVASLQI